MSTLQEILRSLREAKAGVGEVGASLGSGMLAAPVAGVAGLMGLARGRGLEGASRDIAEMQHALTYEPRSDIGQRGLHNVGAALEPILSKLRENIADPVGEVSPAAGAMLLGAANVIGPKGAKPRLRQPAGFDLPTTELLGMSPAKVRRDLGISPTVKNVQQIVNPGIYKDPRIMAQEASALVAPESPALKQLWGTSREELADIASRKGNIEEPLKLIPSLAKTPTGSEAVRNIITPKNTQRLLDILREGERSAPGLMQGMKGWYVQDPMFHRMVQMFGPEEAITRYNRLNAYSGIESPNMAVPNEIRRAAAANYMAEQGRFPEWQQYGGLPMETRAARGLLTDMPSVPGRIGHQRASESQRKMLETGAHGMDSPKAPLYIAASGTPETGFQTSVPVGDAHFARVLGLGDVRKAKTVDASVTTPELAHLTPWFREQIAAPMGLEAVPGQASLWGLGAPQTGVKSAIGAPKLEITSDLIMKRAAQLGESPESVRDAYLAGKQHLGFTTPAMAATLAGGSGAAALIARKLREEQQLQQ